MRTALLTLAIILCVFSASYSAPCYGTDMPKKKTLSVKLESYTIFKRDLENHYGDIKSQQQFFGLSYGFVDWFSVDLKAGAGNIRQRPTDQDEISYRTNFAGGYGLRLKFFDRKKIKGVAGFQHISVHPKSTQIGPDDHKAILDDWQVSLLGSYDFGMVVPYLGTRWSRIDYIHTFNGDRKRVMSDMTEDIGLIAGFNIPVNDKMYLNVEGQFLDSQALAFSVNYNF